MVRLGRRALLAGGMAGLVSACSSGQPSGPSAVPGPKAIDWRGLAGHISGSLALPGTATYTTMRLVENPRYDAARPLAVLSVASAADVATAFAFAQDHDLPVAIRAGGHSYPGWSAGNGRLVVDVRPLRGVHLDGTTAHVGAGASLIDVYAAVSARGRGIAGGSCPTVGMAGLAQGGGVGVLTRVHGLTCDAVTALQVVTADGRVRRVDAQHDPDLFWALRGGGGGHLGVVTSFTLATFAAPTITTFYQQWPISAARHVVPAWVEGLPHADRRLWSTCKLLGGTKHPSGPVIELGGTWLGNPADLDKQLPATPSAPVDVRHTRGFLDTMLGYAGCAGIPVSRCHTGAGGSLPREAFAATSHVIAHAAADLGTLLGNVHGARDVGLLEAGVSMDSLGGAVADVGPKDTAFGHRQALATVQYSATYAGRAGTEATSYVRAFRDAMTPSWGEGAYVNYADAAIRDYRSAYFGANAARLAQVRSTYDPHGFFTQPQDF